MLLMTDSGASAPTRADSGASAPTRAHASHVYTWCAVVQPSARRSLLNFTLCGTACKVSRAEITEEKDDVFRLLS